MRPTTNARQKYYFSKKLKEQLNQIPRYPVTIVEAPSGFGKTTAVREYLRSEHPRAACEWYTCLDEPPIAAWNGVCALFSGINGEIADGMKNLKAPVRDTLSHLANYLKSLGCREETYLIIDNYHLMDFDLHRELISVFSMHENPGLHMIFITQQMDSRQPIFLRGDNIHTVDALSFFFDREGVASLFRMEGLRLTGDELENVFRRTEGWISAIRLQLINYKKTGSLVGPAGIEQLVETAVWNRLQSSEKDFLLAVSVFDSFTALQAAHMLDDEILPGKIEESLKSSEFVRFLPDKRLFIVHSILLDYLRNRFYYYQPQKDQNRIFHKAGCACAAAGQYCLAAKFFYKVKDFDAILSLHFTPKYLDEQKESCEGEVLEMILKECPDETLRAHPSTAIVFAHYALLNGQNELYERLCGVFRLLIRGETDLPREEIQKLTGEFILLESLGKFDLKKMREDYKTACEILRESPDIIKNSVPWLSVFPTALGLFWHEPGGLDEDLRAMDELKPIYRRFNRGQGAGLGHLIRAEAMLLRGEEDEAEISCHKARYEGRAHGQISICIYAALCLARVFILRGDTAGFSAALESIQGYAAPHEDLSMRRMADLCLSIISLQLGVKDYVAPWLYDMESIRKSVNVPVVPFAELLHFRLLLMDRRYSELYAAAQLMLDELRDPEAKIRYLMPQMYCFIFLAVAKHNGGDGPAALGYLREALDLALPDGIYLPFAEHECMPELLARLNVRGAGGREPPRAAPAAQTGAPPPGETGNGGSAALISLCRRQANGAGVIKKALIQKKSPLTPREREIALLAKKRMSAREIAAELYISEKTVSTILRNVYSKLDIHSKNDLIHREF